MIAVIDIGELVKVAWVSLVAGVGITTAYALVVLGSARSLHARREGDSGTAFRYATLAVVMFCLFAAAVVVGVHIMLSKS